MASIKQRSDGVWRARYRDADGQEHARHFKLKRDAQRWLDEVATSVVTGMYVDPRAGAALWSTWTAAWIDGKRGPTAAWRPLRRPYRASPGRTSRSGT